MAKEIDESKQGQSLVLTADSTNTKKLYIESYGCQMNFSDSEIVASILSKVGYNTTDSVDDADLVLINTCSVRDKAEQTIRKRLEQFNVYKRKKPAMKVGVLGCMAERVKHAFLEEEKIVDMVVGPDAYKDLPNLLEEVEGGREAVNVILSKDETYADIAPIRLNSNGVTAFVSITRGCDNMCTFCIVPFTRGRERSRDPYSAKLLDMVATAYPKMRIRFSTSNPQDMTFEVIDTMAKHHNICKYIHLPVQSGSNRILKAMNRMHTREEYFALIDGIRQRIPDCAISQDMITGFPTETEEDHRDTLSLMEYVKYDFGFMFAYSERPGTLAARKIVDDVPEEVKKRRLTEIIDLQQAHSLYRTQAQVGNTVEVLIEGNSKKSDQEWMGRNSQNTVVVFPKEDYKIGDFVMVKITDCTSTTLIGKAVGYSEYFN